MTSLSIIVIATAVVLLGFVLSLRIVKRRERGVVTRLGRVSRRSGSNNSKGSA